MGRITRSRFRREKTAKNRHTGFSKNQCIGRKAVRLECVELSTMNIDNE
jgi:hypothetical protein